MFWPYNKITFLVNYTRKFSTQCRSGPLSTACEMQPNLMKLCCYDAYSILLVIQLISGTYTNVLYLLLNYFVFVWHGWMNSNVPLYLFSMSFYIRRHITHQFPDVGYLVMCSTIDFCNSFALDQTYFICFKAPLI